MPPVISAVLLAWHRPENVRRIAEQLAALDFIGEILVWRNDTAVELNLAIPKVRILDSPSNLICYGRFLAAAQAAHPLIYVQDDDVLVHDIPGLLQKFMRDPTRIHFNLSAWHYPRRGRSYYQESHSALLGWGAIFRKEWLAALDVVPAKTRSSRLFLREADKYFTLLQRRHHAPHAGKLTQLDGHSTPGLALWCSPEHGFMTALAVRDGLSLARASFQRSLPPLWHIVITCHNYANYLAEAVESVMQIDADYEVTIVDDASTDGSQRVAAELRDRFAHIRYLSHERRRGVSSARNTGIASQDSAYVVLLDADDRLGADYLFEAGKLLAAGADIANPPALLFGTERDCWQPPAQTTLPMLLRHNSIHYCSAFRRSWWAEVGGFDEHLKYREDYDFWIRLVARGARARAMTGEHFFYRRHETSKTRESAPFGEDVMRAVRSKHRHLFEAHEVAV
jgi:hypothetical protein